MYEIMIENWQPQIKIWKEIYFQFLNASFEIAINIHDSDGFTTETCYDKSNALIIEFHGKFNQ